MNAPYRIVAIVPASQKAIANRFAALATGRREDLESFTIPLSADGSEPPTHWGLCTGADDQMRRQLGMAVMGSFWFWSIDSATGVLIATNNPSSLIKPVWKVEAFFQEVLELIGLQCVAPPSLPTENQ